MAGAHFTRRVGASAMSLSGDASDTDVGPIAGVDVNWFTIARKDEC